MRTVVFLDLDDTLFQTRPKCPAEQPLHPAAYRRDATPLSFMTGRQHALLGLLTTAATVIPTTARNFEAFRRVTLGFDALAILDFGGVILRTDGTPDPAWDAVVRPQAKTAGRDLHELRQAMQACSEAHGLGVNVRVIADFDMPLYVVAKHPTGDVATLQTIREECLPGLDRQHYFVHANDNNLSVVPRFLGKDRAVRHVLEHHVGPDPVLTIGVGDSLSDAPFLSLCDYTLMPRGCQLFTHSLGPLQEP